MNKLWFPVPILFVVSVVGLFFYSHVSVPTGKGLDIVPSDTMQVVLSVLLTAASLFVVLAKSYGPKDKHWAYSTIGTILGFWLRGSK